MSLEAFNIFVTLNTFPKTKLPDTTPDIFASIRC